MRSIFSEAIGDRVKLIRLGGHLIRWEGGIHHAEIKTSICAGVPAPDDLVGSGRALAGGFGAKPKT